MILDLCTRIFSAALFILPQPWEAAKLFRPTVRAMFPVFSTLPRGEALTASSLNLVNLPRC